MNRTPAVTTGLVICALLGALNVTASLIGLTADGAPPLGIVITGGVLGLITLTAVAPAWRGSRVPKTSGGATRITAVANRLIAIRPKRSGTALLIL